MQTPISSLTCIPLHDTFGRVCTQQRVSGLQLARDRTSPATRGQSASAGSAASSREEGPGVKGQRGMTFNTVAELTQSMLRPMGVASRRLGGPPCDAIERSACRSPKEIDQPPQPRSNGYRNAPTRGRFQETHCSKDQQDSNQQQRDHECHLLNAPHELLSESQKCH